MNGRRAIAGLCMFCALLVSAIAAQSASAISGTTAFTCVKNAKPEDRRGEHCLNEGAAAQEYGHVAVAQDKTTEVIATNEKTENNTTEPSTIRLKFTVAGVPLELTATNLSGSGWIENKLSASGEHYTYTKGTTTFSGVKVVQPAGRGCQVYTDNEVTKTEGEIGVIHTRELKGTTEGQGDFFKYTPAENETFANFFLTCEEGKKIPACEGTFSVIGSVKAKPEGTTAHLSHTEITEQNSLKAKGTKAGFEARLTVSAREKGSSDPFTPLAETTVTT